MLWNQLNYVQKPREEFLLMKETFVWHTAKGKIFLNWKKVLSIHRNFLWPREIDFLTIKIFFSIQQNFFYFKGIFSDSITKKCFFDSKKLFSEHNSGYWICSQFTMKTKTDFKIFLNFKLKHPERSFLLWIKESFLKLIYFN